jgi:serine phosphatase RsbU (regulator of sigma subunit)/anti-sigma regulatory factor (Ser/Thr protein kinase)
VNHPHSPNPQAAGGPGRGNTPAPFVAAEFLKTLGFRRRIDRLRDGAAIVVSALVGALVSASIGATTLIVSGRVPDHQFASAWAVWWTGDAMGILVVTPFLLSLLDLKRWARSPWSDRVEATILIAILAALTVVVARAHANILFAVLPLVGWAAWRFQQRASAPAVLVVSVIATWAVARHWGPFADENLFGSMLTLQAFNATVAFSSFCLAALVTERMESRGALERAAAELEERVVDRTKELHDRERQLADAQHMAHVGSWLWVISTDEIWWSDEMYRIHGHAPQSFRVTFDVAMSQVHPDDAGPIRANVLAAFERAASHVIPPREYRIRRTDGEERVLIGRARLEVDAEGLPIRMLGTVQDVTEERRAEREHAIAETLQRSLLPEMLPEIPGIRLAARYVPASAEAEVGGDWYDVILLPDGHVGIAIGDVAGHGLRAAATMGQLRMALRAYAVEEDSPARVVTRLQELVRTVMPTEMATVLYLVHDLDQGTVTFCSAGHPPPLVVPDAGEGEFVTEGLFPPLGAPWFPQALIDAVRPLSPRDLLVLFTDGLVERRGDSLAAGMARLKDEATSAHGDPDQACDHLVRTMLGPDVADDVAVLAMRPVALAGRTVTLRLPAEPRSLAPLRHTIRRWLREAGATEEEAFEILVACGEACSNAIQHPHGARGADLEVEIALRDGEVRFDVRDSGTWRTAPTGGGLGVPLMNRLMDRVEVDRRGDGTTVRLRRRLRGGPIDEPAGAR